MSFLESMIRTPVLVLLPLLLVCCLAGQYDINSYSEHLNVWSDRRF
jgi:hypothetical protein